MIDQRTVDSLLDPVHRFFVNKVSSPIDADDCTQQTFERLLSRSGHTDIQSIEAFAFGIARNVLHEYWRSQARLRHTDDIGELSISEMGAGVSTILNLEQWQQLLFDALRTLRLDHQTVLELHYWEGKKYEEIAVLLDIPKGTVGTWITRGRDALAKRLAIVAVQEGRKSFADEELEKCLAALREPAGVGASER